MQCSHQRPQCTHHCCRCHEKLNKPFVAALGTLNNEKPVLVLAASPDVAEKVNLREVVNMAASYIGGKGGGRPTLVQAGGTDASRLSVAVQQAIYECKRRLGLA